MDIPSPCPCCGALSLLPDVQTTTLVAVCDVLVTKALEKVGQFMVRGERSRYNQRGSTPWHEVHTRWRGTDDQVGRALRGAWDVVAPLVEVHGCCGITPAQIERMLDDYVHDLVVTGTAHTVPELEYRFTSRLSLALPEHTHA